MVRFSDMLGGSDDPKEPRAQTAPRDLPPEVDDEPDLDAPPAADDAQLADEAPVAPTAPATQSPQDVLDRLTQYASSARAAERTPEPVEPAADPAPTPPPVAAHEPEAPPRAPANPDEPAGDDILPRPKPSLRKPGRGAKRRP